MNYKINERKKKNKYTFRKISGFILKTVANFMYSGAGFTILFIVLGLLFLFSLWKLDINKTIEIRLPWKTGKPMKCAKNMLLPELIRSKVQSGVKVTGNMPVLTALPAQGTLLSLTMKFLKFPLKFSGCSRKVRFVNNFSRRRAVFLSFLY